jgi:hypothetical protein
MKLSSFILLDLDKRQTHLDLGAPCQCNKKRWSGKSGGVFRSLLDLFGLADDIGNRRGAGVHLIHACRSHSHSEQPCSNPSHIYLGTVNENSARPPRIEDPPVYDGSRGALPVSNVDHRYLLDRYRITKPTLFKRKNALRDIGKVKHIKAGGSKFYYSPRDVYLLDCVDFWMSAGWSVAEVTAFLVSNESLFESRV